MGKEGREDDIPHVAFPARSFVGLLVYVLWS